MSRSKDSLGAERASSARAKSARTAQPTSNDVGKGRGERGGFVAARTISIVSDYATSRVSSQENVSVLFVTKVRMRSFSAKARKAARRANGVYEGFLSAQFIGAAAIGYYQPVDRQCGVARNQFFSKGDAADH
jgi:hypothetical protein